MTARPGDRVRVAAGRAVLRSRGERRTRGDTAYLVYVVLLVTAITGVPLVRAIVLWLASSDMSTAIGQPGGASAVSILGGLIWIGAFALGRIRGPIVPSAFLAVMLGRSDISTRAAWTRHLLGTLGGTAVVTGGAAALTVSGLIVNGTAVPDCLAFIAGAGMFAVPTVAIWLAGQVLGRRKAAVLGGLLLLYTAVAALIPGPVGLAYLSPLGALWPVGANLLTDPAIWGWALSAPVITTLVSAAALPVLLGRLEPDVLEDHALRWEAMTVLAGTGDISGALDRTRPRPSIGRRMRIPLRQPLVLAVLQRDAIGAIRTPVRAASACAALLLAGAGWAWAAQYESGPRWIPAVAAGLLAFTSLGAFVDGLREAADTAGRPALYGRAPGRLLLLHLPLPLLVAVLAPTLAAALTGATATTAAVVAISAAVIVMVRAYDATKGPLPIELMMPVPTPAGDASAIGMWAWQADALLWTSGVSFLLFAATTAGPIALLWAAPAGLLLAALTAARLRRSAS